MFALAENRKANYANSLGTINDDVTAMQNYFAALNANKRTQQDFIDTMGNSSLAAQNLQGNIIKLADEHGNLDRITQPYITQQTGIANATYASGKAFNWAGIQAKFLSVALNMVAWLIVAESIKWLINRYDEWNVTLAEAKESLKATQSELEDLNKELETNATRLKEISKLKVKTPSDKAEYNQLVKENDELERRKNLLEETEKIKAHEVSKTFVKEMGTIGTSYAEKIKDTPLNGEQPTYGNQNSTYAEYLESLSARLKEIADMRKAALEAGNQPLVDQSDENTQHVYENLDKISNAYARLTEGITYYVAKQGESLTAEEQKSNDWLDKANQVIDMIAFLKGDSSGLTRILNSYAFEGFAQQLKVSVESGNLSAEKLQTSFNPLLQLFSSFGIDAETAANKINIFFANEKNGVGVTYSLASSIADAGAALDGIQKSYDIVSQAVEEYNSGGVLSVDTAQKLLGLGSDYIDILYDENGHLVLNTEAFKGLAMVQLSEMRASLEATKSEIDSKAVDILNAKTEAIYALTGAYTLLERAELVRSAKTDVASLYKEYDAKIAMLDTLEQSINNGKFGTAKDTGNPIKEAFDAEKALLDGQKSRFEAGMSSSLSSMSEYYDRLEEIALRYYGNSEKDLTQYEVAIFEGRKKIITDAISNQENAILFWGKTKGNEAQIVATYRAMQASVHDLAESYRVVDSTANSALIDDLSKQWWGYEDAIKVVYDKLATDAKTYADKIKKETQDVVDAKVTGLGNIASALSSSVDSEEDFTVIKNLLSKFEKEIASVNLEIDPTGLERANATLEKGLAVLQRSKELEEEATERKEKQLAIDKLRLQLENTLAAKKVQTLKQQTDGTWDYEYAADITDVDAAKKALKDAETEFDKWDIKQQARRNQDKYTDLQNAAAAEKRIVEDSLFDIEKVVKKSLDELKLKFGNDIPAITRSLTEMIDTLLAATGVDMTSSSASLGVTSSYGNLIDGVQDLDARKYLNNLVMLQSAYAEGNLARIAQLEYINTLLAKSTNIKLGEINGAEAAKLLKSKGFAGGGVNDEPGLAMLHGTSSRPEMILNSDQIGNLFAMLSRPVSPSSSLISGGLKAFIEEMQSIGSDVKQGVTNVFKDLKVVLPNIKNGDDAANFLEGLNTFAYQYANKV